MRVGSRRTRGNILLCFVKKAHSGSSTTTVRAGKGRWTYLRGLSGRNAVRAELVRGSGRLHVTASSVMSFKVNPKLSYHRRAFTFLSLLSKSIPSPVDSVHHVRAVRQKSTTSCKQKEKDVTTSLNRTPMLWRNRRVRCCFD